MIITKRPSAKALLGGVLALVLAATTSACGSSDESSTTKDGLTKVRLASAGAYPTAVDVYWAKEGGFFEKHGLDVTLNPPSFSAADLANTVISGDADLAVLLGTVVPSVRQAGKPLTIVGTTQTPIPLQMAFSPKVDKQLRAKGLSEESPLVDLLTALKGLTIGTNPAGSATTSAYRYLMAQFDIDPEKDGITLQPLPDIASGVAALSNGRVDGLASSLGGSSTGAAAQGTGIVWDLTKMSGSEALSEISVNSIVASEQMIGNDPETIQSFLDAMREAQQAVKAGLSPEDSARIKKIIASEMDDKLYDETIVAASALFPDSYTTSEAAWDALVGVAEVTSDQPLDTPYEDGVDNQFAEKVK